MIFQNTSKYRHYNKIALFLIFCGIQNRRKYIKKSQFQEKEKF